MQAPKIFESEYRFACIVWEKEPVTTKELVKLCAERLSWKRTTTYTVLKRLCERGILKMEDSIVTSLYSKEEIQRSESQEFLDRTFEGSLPSFFAAFLNGKKLSAGEVQELQEMIDAYKASAKE